MGDLVPSPYGPQKTNKPIPKYLIDYIKKEMECEVVVLAVEAKKSNCDDEICLGHMSEIAAVGVSEHHLRGIGVAIKQNAESIIKESEDLL